MKKIIRMRKICLRKSRRKNRKSLEADFSASEFRPDGDVGVVEVGEQYRTQDRQLWNCTPNSLFGLEIRSRTRLICDVQRDTF